MRQKMDKICPFFLNLLGGNGVPFPERKIGLWNERGHPLRWPARATERGSRDSTNPFW